MSSFGATARRASATVDAPDVWKALANPWRRQLLDQLRGGPRTTGDLSTGLAEPAGLSRFAVMQHLEVLVAAGLVVVHRRGRHRYNHLNPVPLREWYERWVQPLADSTAAELLSLQRLVHQPGDTFMTAASSGTSADPSPVEAGGDEPIRTIRLTAELRFATTPERLFKAFTDESLAWFPYTYGGERVRAVVVEPFVGGRHYEDWGDGRGHLYGHTTEYDPPFHWATRGRLMPGTIHDSFYDITPDGPEHVALRVTKVVSGPMTDEEAASVRTHGDLTLMADALRAHVES